MRKIGPLSLDLVVACKIYELQATSPHGVEFRQITEGLHDIVGKSTIQRAIGTLSDWGILKAEFGETSSGRAGRLYYVTGEAEAMIKETYETFWDNVLAVTQVTST